MAEAPHTLAGLIKLPSVSLPTENGTVPATVLAIGPAPPQMNHTSFLSQATHKDPVSNLFGKKGFGATCLTSICFTPSRF